MKTFITADQLIDGTGAAPLCNPILELEGGRILAVHDGSAGLPDSEAGELLEYPGATILPGLIDTHVHLNLPGTGPTLEEAMREGTEVMTATAMGSAAQALGAGITTVRDLGAFGTTSFAARRALELGYGKGARVIACGAPITITGGHCWQMGGTADGIEGSRRKVRELCRDGADFIKVMGSGGGTVGTRSWKPSFTRDEMNAIVDEAHRNERRVTVHCLCGESISNAVAAGADQIEHANFLVDASGRQEYDPAVVDQIARAGIPVTTTLVVYVASVFHYRSKERLTPVEQAMVDKWCRRAEETLDYLDRMTRAGVRFVAGTDAGWRFTPFDALMLELEIMNKGGYATLDAITAATGDAADVIGAEDIGKLRPGRRADVLVVDGDPLADLDCLRDPLLILQDGARQHITGRANLTPTAQAGPL
ncbi:amidohydrolase family protein [Roseovarius sp. PS-C2]|uniref:metal-dependent hydrolase family protein n=1 Tax=Roseovarius sp. PS-C2 TaxID=2820814 RepID=UPI001C0A9A4D|nr:amidohydrolase family protein [Roseovarius sp. PS-C2]MBU3261610.1 amidohydrolase family protein [Roseovarius sp. PS-C2]